MEDKLKQAHANLDHLRNSSDFLMFGSPLEGYDDRYVKFSDKKSEHGFKKGVKYVGEWSKETNKPHGRGVRIKPNGDIGIGYWD